MNQQQIDEEQQALINSIEIKHLPPQEFCRGDKNKSFCPCNVTMHRNKDQLLSNINILYKQNPQKIPKIVHQIWIGPKPVPKVWTDTIEKMVQNSPKWSYKLWDNDAVEALFPLTNQPLYDKEPEWCGKADIIRLEILYRYGGIYIDADMACLNCSRDISFFIKNTNYAGFFTAYESENIHDGLANSFMGASEKNLYILYLIRLQMRMGWDCFGVVPPFQRLGPMVLDTAFVVNGAVYKNITVFPSKLVFPEHWLGIDPNDLKQMKISDFATKFPDAYFTQFGYSTNQFSKVVMQKEEETTVVKTVPVEGIGTGSNNIEKTVSKTTKTFSTPTPSEEPQASSSPGYKKILLIGLFIFLAILMYVILSSNELGL